MATRASILTFALSLSLLATFSAHSAESCKTILAQLFEQNRKPLLSDEEIKEVHSWFEGPHARTAPRRLYEAIIEKQMENASPKIREAVDRLYRRQYFRIVEKDPKKYEGTYYFSADDLGLNSHQIQIRMEEELFETAKEFTTLSHEMRHAIQRLTAIDRGIKKVKDFSGNTLLKELDSIQAEWQYARNLPPKYRNDLIVVINKSNLPANIKKTTIRLLEDPDSLTIRDFKKIRKARGYSNDFGDFAKIMGGASAVVVAVVSCPLLDEGPGRETWYYRNICKLIGFGP